MALVLPRGEIFLWGRNFCRIILGILAALLAAKIYETNETSNKPNETTRSGPTKPNETVDHVAIFKRNRTRPVSRVIILIPANGKFQVSFQNTPLRGGFVAGFVGQRNRNETGNETGRNRDSQRLFSRILWGGVSYMK